jgi:hypothetical protein
LDWEESERKGSDAEDNSNFLYIYSLV